jgi:hypothetical protein
MKLYRGALVMTMMAGAAMLAGCRGNDGSSQADNTAVSTTPVSDTDTTDETAPTAPPAPEADSPGSPPSSGDVYVQGSWRYSGGKYVWGRGHWEPPHPGATLAQARWVEVNGKWQHHPARWSGGGKAAPAAAHPAERGAEHPAEPAGRPEEHHR